MAFTNVFEFKPVERRECGAKRKLKCAPKLYTGIYWADRTEKIIKIRKRQRFGRLLIVNDTS